MSRFTRKTPSFRPISPGRPRRALCSTSGGNRRARRRRIYPYPLYDNLTGKKVDKTYKLVYLENEYVHIGILPEIGGRIFEGMDKTNGYHFFYRQHVIKPTLIGIIGAWISGGIEWDVIRTTIGPRRFSPCSTRSTRTRTAARPSGWASWSCGSGCVGPPAIPCGRANPTWKPIRILNRTPVVNTMLCFANAAVYVNDHYQVIFPPWTQL